MKIGDSVPRPDAVTKVKGIEKYAADYYSGTDGGTPLWAGVKRAGVPHGLIKSLNVAAASKAPGVVTVLTHRDITGTNRQGVVKQDQPVLADEKVRHRGEGLALVLAKTKEAVKTALDLIDVVIEPLPGLFTIEDALSEDAPLLHADSPTGNIIKEVTVVKGKGEAAFEECDIIVDFSFTTPRQEHAYLETEAGWAFMDSDGTIVMVASTQTPFRDRLEVGHALGLNPEQIRIVAPYLGGAFGGKDGVTVQAFLALAVLHSNGRPVKMWWDREESFLAGVKRLPAAMKFRLGAQSDGTMVALSSHLFFEGGAYANLSGEIMTLAAEHAGGPYRIPHTFIHGCSVYTNNGLGGPFRGFGVPQVTAAMEQTVDILAERLKMDPIELRLKNSLTRGDENCLGVAMVHSTSVRECLHKLRAHEMWQQREAWKSTGPVFKRRGVGVACLLHAMGYPKDVPDRAGAKVELTPEGKIRVCTGVVDMGQGNGSTYLQIAGSILNQNEDDLELRLPDTSLALPCGSASASRCTYVFGNALVEAVKDLKEVILAKTAVLLQTDKNGITLEPGFARLKVNGQRVSLARVAAACTNEERVVTRTFTSPTAKEDSSIIYLGPHLLYSYGAHLVRLEVDELTGEVEIKDYLAVTDGGRVLNPQIYEQQIQGSIAQGIGHALTERFVLEDGRIVTPNLATYTIPTSVDIPDLRNAPVEVEEETGPFGMKGIGEIAINGPVPAIANALHDALGVRFDSAPFTGETILKGIVENQTR